MRFFGWSLIIYAAVDSTLTLVRIPLGVTWALGLPALPFPAQRRRQRSFRKVRSYFYGYILSSRAMKIVTNVHSSESSQL